MNICILFSTPFPPEEGIGSYVYNLSHNLVEKGHRVSLITRGSWKNIPPETADGITVYKPRFLPVYPLHVHLHGIFVNRLLRSLEPEIDIIHVHSPLCPPVISSVPVVTTVHTPMVTDARFVQIADFRSLVEKKIAARFVSYPLELKLLRRSDIVTTVAKSVARELAEYGMAPDDIAVIGNGVNEKTFHPAPLPIENSERYVLYVGRLDHRKGLFDLLECARQICLQYPDVTFVLAGGGPLFDKLKKKAQELNLQERVALLGRVNRDRVMQLYRKATISVIPSHYEGLPTVLLEAMSCGLPVVATAVSGNVEVVSSGENGLLIPPKSPGKMAEAITTLLDDDDLRTRLGNAARDTIEKHYTWDMIADRVLRIYESLVNK